MQEVLDKSKHNDVLDFKLNKYEIETLNHLQKFRYNPQEFVNNQLKSILIMFKKVPHNEQKVKELENTDFNDFIWNDNYILSHGLCKAAYEVCSKMNDNQISSNKIKEICSKYIENFNIDYELYTYSEFEGDDTFLIIRFIANDNDPSRIYKQLLKEKQFKYVGICHLDEEKKFIIFSKQAEKEAYLSINMYLQLKDMYDKFDINKNNKIDVNYVLLCMDDQLYGLKNPYTYQMFKRFLSIKNKKYNELGLSFIDFIKEVQELMSKKLADELLIEFIYEFIIKENEVLNCLKDIDKDFNLYSEGVKIESLKNYSNKIIPIKKLKIIFDNSELFYRIKNKNEELYYLKSLLKKFEGDCFISFDDFISIYNFN